MGAILWFFKTVSPWLTLGGEVTITTQKTLNEAEE
jgi:hypothetical protein